MTCPKCGHIIEEERIFLNDKHTRWKFNSKRRILVLASFDRKGIPQYSKERTVEYYTEVSGVLHAGLKINNAYVELPVPSDAIDVVSVRYDGRVDWSVEEKKRR